MNLLDSLEQNPFFSGGLSLMAIGAVGAILRHLPMRIMSFLERRISISVEVPDRDPAFRWVQTWLAAGRYAKRARDLSLATEWVSSEPDPEISPYGDQPSGPASEARFVLTPAPGIHLTAFRGRILVVRRTRRELQSGGSTAFQESLILQILGGSRKLIDELLAEAHSHSFPRTPGVSILTARNELWCPASWQPKRPTNHPERLDPALLRAGRVDRKIELGYATPDQARRLYLWFFQGCGLSQSELCREAERFAAQVPPGKIGMAAIQEHLLRHRRSPGSAAHEIVFDEITLEPQMAVI